MTDSGHGEQAESGDEPDDAALLIAVRAGDSSATAALYARHSRAAIAMARALTRDSDTAQDLVQEAFASVLAAIEHGAGPVDSFRAYLLATIRNAHYRNSRQARRVTPTDDPELFNSQLSAEDDPAQQMTMTFDSELIMAAFRTLPARWQRVLWSSEVEGLTAQQLATEFQVSPNTAAALAYRARNALAQAFLRAHVDGGLPADCVAIAPRLASWIRTELTARQASIVARHVDECESCSAIVADLKGVNRALRTVTPLLVGLPALVGYGTYAGGAGHSATSAAAGPNASGIAGHTGAAGHFFSRLLAKLSVWSTATRIAAGAAVIAPIAAVLAVVLTAQHSSVSPPSAPQALPSPTTPIGTRTPAPLAPVVSAPASPSPSVPSSIRSSGGLTAADPPLPTAPPPRLAFSVAPPPMPLEVSVADRGSEQTLELASDVGSFERPVLRLSALPAGWHATLSGMRSGVSCGETSCTIRAVSETPPSVAIVFNPDADAVDGTAVLTLFPTDSSTKAIVSYSIPLNN